jgi:tetratricopeptide (TPR) repeat protein
LLLQRFTFTEEDLRQLTSDLLSLCIICRDDADNISRLVKSARPHIAEIIVVDTGSLDESVSKAKNAGADIVHSAPDLLTEDGLLKSFGKARQLSYSLSTKKWQLWLDTDDDLSDWKALDPLVVATEATWQEKPGFNVCLWYDYSWTPDRSRCIQSYTRKRLTRAVDGWSWHRPVHEYIAREGDEHTMLAMAATPRVIHLSQHARGATSDRNLRILQQWEKDGAWNEDPDAFCFYMGDEMLIRARYKEAIDYFTRLKFNPRDPSWHARAVFRASRAMMLQGLYADAAKYLTDMIKINPNSAQHYWELARACALLGDRALAANIMKKSEDKYLIMGEDAIFGDQLRQYLGMT